MIPVILSRPPLKYSSKVKVPGQAFLRKTAAPSASDWVRHAYWRKVHDDLYRAHRGICAYCASWTPRRRRRATHTNHTSIDHFIPKSVDPQNAYEWSNFRLCRTRLNNRKGDHQDVLDPCKVEDGWFQIDFNTFRITAAAGLPDKTKSGVEQTISRLGLNLDNDYVQERIAVLRAYVLGKITMCELQSLYPFVARQIERQNFDSRYKPRMLAYFRGLGVSRNRGRTP